MRTRFVAVALLLACSHAAPAPAPQQPPARDWIARSNENAQVLLDVRARFTPEFAARTGVAGIESLYHNHRGDNGLRGGLNNVEDNQRRADMEEAARMGGLDAVVNVVVNSRREIAGLLVGDLVGAPRAGVALARRVFSTPVPEGWDVGVFNAYPKNQLYRFKLDGADLAATELHSPDDSLFRLIFPEATSRRTVTGADTLAAPETAR